MNIKTLSNLALHHHTLEAARAEKTATHTLLIHLAEIDYRRAYLDRGYSSLYTYIKDGLTYSEGATQERVEATRLLHTLPELKSDLIEGKITLTNLAKTAAVIHRAERAHGKSIPLEKKHELLKFARTQSKRELERTLLNAEVDFGLREDAVLRPLVLQVTEQTLEMYDRYCELNGKIAPGLVFEKLLTDYLKRNDPKLKQIPHSQQVTSKADTTQNSNGEITKSVETPQPSHFHRHSVHRRRYIPIREKQIALQRAHFSCEFQDPVTGKRCGSHSYLHFDHYPVKFRDGGKDTADNLRVLCALHNLAAG